ncbi:hypothetical protein ACFVMC_23320 [Nocardia sp. NPDC127579]|uniref:hypothetical protein n=1 Tax=Nocardia sp. NPDC127579 TaxID=3345402 RepID=UPI00362A9D4B
MARELKADLELMEAVSKVWLNKVAPDLKAAAALIEPLQYTSVEFGPLFYNAWWAYAQASAYIKDRLNEGVPAAEKIGNALHAAVVTFGEQQEQQEVDTKKQQQKLDDIAKASG